MPPGIIDLDLWGGERRAEWWSQGSGATQPPNRTAGNNSEPQARAALPALLLCLVAQRERCVSLLDSLWVTAECLLLTQLQQI